MNFLKKHRYDIIVILALLVISGGFFVYLAFGRDAGAQALITLDGEEVMRLDLGEDTSITIGEGEHYNTVTVQNGEVFVSDASCPDHVCVKSGKKGREGEMIVCLPNKLIITVEGGDDSELDAVTG